MSTAEVLQLFLKLLRSAHRGLGTSQRGRGGWDFFLLPLFSSVTACFSYGMRVLLKIFLFFFFKKTSADLKKKYSNQ